MIRRPRLGARLFTDAELAYGRRHTDPAPSLAARFAAKEATMKALGVGLGSFAFRDVEVVRADSGAPRLNLTGGAFDLATALGVLDWKLSLTHTASMAEAVVLAVGAGR